MVYMSCSVLSDRYKRQFVGSVLLMVGSFHFRSGSRSSYGFRLAGSFTDR